MQEIPFAPGYYATPQGEIVTTKSGEPKVMRTRDNCDKVMFANDKDNIVTVDTGERQRLNPGRCIICDVAVTPRARTCSGTCRNRLWRKRRDLRLRSAFKRGLCVTCGGRLQNEAMDFCSEICKEVWYERMEKG